MSDQNHFQGRRRSRRSSMSESQMSDQNPSRKRRPSAPAAASPRGTAAELHILREAIRREAQAFGMGLQPADLESPDLPSFLKLTETDVEHQVQTLVTRESDIRRLVEMGKNTIEPKSTEVTAKSSPTTGSVVSAASPASVCKFFLPVKGRQATPFPTNSVASGSLASSIRSPAPSTPKAIHQQNPMNLTVPATAPMTVTRIERPSGAFAERRGRQEQPERSNAVEGLLPSLLPQPADAHMQTETSQPVEESRRVRFAEVDQSQDKTVVPSSPSVHGTEQSPAGVKTLATESEGGPAPVTGVSGSPPIDDTAPSRGSGSASSSRPRSRASTRSRATSQLLPGPLPMIPSPLISDSLNAVINVTKRFREVTQALGFRDDDAFKVWCKRCVEWSFDEFYKPYMKDWSNYAQRLSKAEVDEATNIGCRALIALIKEDQTGFLEGHLNRLQLFARFAIDVVHEDDDMHAEIPEDNSFLCEHPLGNTQKIRGLIMLADFLLDCRFVEATTRRKYFAASARASARRNSDEDSVKDDDDQKGKGKDVISPREHFASVAREKAQASLMDISGGEK